MGQQISTENYRHLSDEELKRFSERLRSIRLRRGWSQDVLAEKLGVKPSSVGNWESRINGPLRSRIKSIADTLGVSVEFLLGIDEAVKAAALLHDIGQPPYGAEYKVTLTTRSTLAKECLEHFADFLNRAGDDPAHLGWTLVELRNNFPLNKWESATPKVPPSSAPLIPGTSSSEVTDLARRGARAGASKVGVETPAPEPTHPTDEPNVDKP